MTPSREMAAVRTAGFVALKPFLMWSINGLIGSLEGEGGREREERGERGGGEGREGRGEREGIEGEEKEKEEISREGVGGGSEK